MAVARREPQPLGIEDTMVALIEAMSLDGCVGEVSEDAEIAEPIEIVNIASGEGAYSLYSRIEIALGVGARASFVETFLGAGKAVQRHAATTLTLAKGARLKHVGHGKERGHAQMIDEQMGQRRCQPGREPPPDGFASRGQRRRQGPHPAADRREPRRAPTLGDWTRRGLETRHGRDGVTLADERASQQGTQTSTTGRSSRSAGLREPLDFDQSDAGFMRRQDRLFSLRAPLRGCRAGGLPLNLGRIG